MPRGGGFEVLSPGSAGFMNERQGRDHLGEALVALQEVDDEVGGWVVGTVVTRLMVLEGESCRGRDVETLIGQEGHG